MLWDRINVPFCDDATCRREFAGGCGIRNSISGSSFRSLGKLRDGTRFWGLFAGSERDDGIGDVGIHCPSLRLLSGSVSSVFC